MKFIVVNDCHIGSRYQDDPDIREKVLALKPHKNTILIGDVVDLACCKKSDVSELIWLLHELIEKHGNNLDYGNHERVLKAYRDMVRITETNKKVLFVHGDLEGNLEKWTAYRLQPQGASLFKLAQTFIFDGLDTLKALRPLPKGFLDRAAAKAKSLGCEYYVCGHFHPKKQLKYEHEGVTIIINPMGINEVEIA